MCDTGGNGRLFDELDLSPQYFSLPSTFAMDRHFRQFFRAGHADIGQ
jgi:hypothetical protein